MIARFFRLISTLSGIRSRKYIGVLAVSAVAALIAGFFAIQNRINGDISAMAPDKAPSVKTLREIEKRFGATNTLIVLILAPAGKDISGRLDEIARTVEESSYVKRVDYRMDTSFFEDRGLYYLTEKELEDLRERIDKRIKEETIKATPFYVDLEDEDEVEEEKADPIDSEEIASRFEGANYVKDGYFRKVVDEGKREVWALIVNPSKGGADVNYAKDLIEDVWKKIDALQLGDEYEVLMSGRYYYLASEGKQIFSDIRRISIIASLCVLVAVFCFFPNIFTLFLIFLPLVFGLAFDFALVKGTIGELNMATAGNFAILFGMGVAYAVHVYARFREERKLGHQYEDAMERSVGDTGWAVFLSAATTAGAFFVLMAASYKGFSQLGFITGFGVIFTLLTALIVMPAIGKPLAARNLLRKHRETGTPTEDLVKLWAKGPPLSKAIAAAGVVMTVACFILMFGLEYEMDYNKLTIKDDLRKKAEIYERKLFGMSGEPAVTYAEGREELVRLVDHLDRVSSGEEGKYLIDKVISILSFIPENQDGKRRIVKEIRKLAYNKKLNLAEGEEKESIKKLREISSAEPFDIKDIPGDARSRFEGEGDKYLVYIYPQRNITNLEEAMNVRDLLTGMRIGDKTINATNTSIVFAEIQDLMLADTPIVISLAFLVVMACVLLVFRSVKDCFLSLIPLFVGLTWMMGIMALAGVKINYFNIIAIPAVIGIGVDSGVHIVHRYRVEGIASLRRIIRNLGRTLLICTLTTVLGFGSLLFASHPGVRSLGLAAVIGLTTTFIASVLFLPAVIYLYARVTFRRLLHSRPGVVVWTMSFDPMTEALKARMRAEKVEFKIIPLDEMPGVERGMALRFIRRSIKEDLYFPVIEVKGKLRSVGNLSMPDFNKSVGTLFS
ncbi:MAG: MMPL family transporter [Pseudomonadota bacterium]